MTSSKARLYQTCTAFLMAGSLITRKRQRWAFPPLGAHCPACRIWRMSASGTGSALRRRIERVVWMISNRSELPDIVSPLLTAAIVPYARREVNRPSNVLEPRPHWRRNPVAPRLHACSRQEDPDAPAPRVPAAPPHSRRGLLR